MSSKQQADGQAMMQREKEREKRRLRDRQRRQNMSQDQREKHLARRRKNYQLRRLRAQNLDTNLDTNHQFQLNNHHSFTQLQLQPSSTHIQEEKAHRKYPRRLRVSHIRHLARRLHSNDQQLNGGVGASCKRLRLTHVKRLARAVKATGNKISSEGNKSV